VESVLSLFLKQRIVNINLIVNIILIKLISVDIIMDYTSFCKKILVDAHGVYPFGTARVHGTPIVGRAFMARKSVVTTRSFDPFFCSNENNSDRLSKFDTGSFIMRYGLIFINMEILQRILNKEDYFSPLANFDLTAFLL